MRIHVLAVILFTVIMSFASPASAATENFLSLSDIHFDPFLSCQSNPCPLIQKLRAAPATQWEEILRQNDNSTISYGKDTNYPLFASSLAAAQTEAQKAKIDFVLVLGDFLAHRYDRLYRYYSGDNSKAGYQDFLNKTMAFITGKLNQAFPQQDIYWAVGNVDTYGGDYAPSPSSPYYWEMNRIMAPLVKNEGNRQTLQQQFPKAGYYAVNAPGQPSLRLIFLNTVLFSSLARGHNIDEDALKELAWLHQQLQMAIQKNQQVLLAFHIPPGIDAYKTSLIPFGLHIVQFWKEPYSKQFIHELEQASSHILGVFTGHIHADAFQILTVDNGRSIPFTGTPAISPIFGTNPGFKIYSFTSPDLHLVDFVTFYSNLQTNRWEKEYDFDEVYQLNNSVGEIINGMNQLQPEGTLSDQYRKFYGISTDSQPITKSNKWTPYYWCTIKGLTEQKYKDCLKASSQ